MKTCILVAFAVCCALAVCEAKRCDSNDDCASDECCVQVVRFMPSKCLKLKQKNDHCLKDLELENNRYPFSCPCAEGLECKSSKDEDHNGIVNFLNDRCQ